MSEDIRMWTQQQGTEKNRRIAKNRKENGKPHLYLHQNLNPSADTSAERWCHAEGVLQGAADRYWHAKGTAALAIAEAKTQA